MPRLYHEYLHIAREAIERAREEIQQQEDRLIFLGFDEGNKMACSFGDLSVNDRVIYTKREFTSVVKNIFENPEILKNYINEKKLSNEQSKVILKIVNKLNSKTCACCRRFDQAKLQISPIERELEPLLDIAQVNVKARSY